MISSYSGSLWQGLVLVGLFVSGLWALDSSPSDEVTSDIHVSQTAKQSETDSVLQAKNRKMWIYFDPVSLMMGIASDMPSYVQFTLETYSRVNRSWIFQPYYMWSRKSEVAFSAVGFSLGYRFYSSEKQRSGLYSHVKTGIGRLIDEGSTIQSSGFGNDSESSGCGFIYAMVGGGFRADGKKGCFFAEIEAGLNYSTIHSAGDAFPAPGFFFDFDLGIGF